MEVEPAGDVASPIVNGLVERLFSSTLSALPQKRGKAADSYRCGYRAAGGKYFTAFVKEGVRVTAGC